MAETLSVCLLTRNERPFLEQWLPRVMEFADQLCVLDTGSTDGSIELVRQWLRPGDVLDAVSSHLLEEVGFGEARERLCAHARCDWVHTLDADEMLSPEQRPLIKQLLGYTESDAVAIHTWTYPTSDRKDWDYINELTPVKESHRRIYRRTGDFHWRGFIHEELYLGEKNCASFCWLSPIIHHHYTNYRTFQDPQEKQKRYARMLLRAYDNPELQKYVNAWWFRVHVPQNLEHYRKLADARS